MGAGGLTMPATVRGPVKVAPEFDDEILYERYKMRPGERFVVLLQSGEWSQPFVYAMVDRGVRFRDARTGDEYSVPWAKWLRLKLRWT